MKKSIEERIEEFKGDKRSKAYKSLKEELALSLSENKESSVEELKTRSKGVGDTIEKVTKATGIKKVVKFLFGDDCGCDERKVKLNKMFPYRVECLTESEFTYIDDLLGRIGNRISPDDQQEILIIYNRVFNTKKRASNCSQCWRDIIKHIKKLHAEYIKEMS